MAMRDVPRKRAHSGDRSGGDGLTDLGSAEKEQDDKALKAGSDPSNRRAPGGRRVGWRAGLGIAACLALVVPQLFGQGQQQRDGRASSYVAPPPLPSRWPQRGQAQHFDLAAARSPPQGFAASRSPPQGFAASHAGQTAHPIGYRGAASATMSTLGSGLRAAGFSSRLPARLRPSSSREGPQGGGVALLTVASHAKATARGAEYGELKAAYMYAVSVDNKARFCAAHDSEGCTLVVGHPVPEARGRSARWLKVAWLRRCFDQGYEWLVWMDLDAIWARADASLEEVLDPAFDLHVTEDFGRPDRINTGFFALRATPWASHFLEQVWDHNDFGNGQSDQASINHCISLLTNADRALHIKVYPRELLNAFPAVAFVPVEGYALPKGTGDEVVGRSLVVHFAGQFGGARSFDGTTTPLMLVQFLDLLLAKHQAFMASLSSRPPQTANHSVARTAAAAAMAAAVAPKDEALEVIARSRAALATCLEQLARYEPSFDFHLGIPVFIPPGSTAVAAVTASAGATTRGPEALAAHSPDSAPGAEATNAAPLQQLACDPAAALTALRRNLATLLPPPPPLPPSKSGETTEKPRWPRFLLCLEPPALAEASLAALPLAAPPIAQTANNGDAASKDDPGTLIAASIGATIDFIASSLASRLASTRSSVPVPVVPSANLELFKTVEVVVAGKRDADLILRLAVAAAPFSRAGGGASGLGHRDGPRRDDGQASVHSDGGSGKEGGARSVDASMKTTTVTVAVSGCAIVGSRAVYDSTHRLQAFFGAPRLAAQLAAMRGPAGRLGINGSTGVVRRHASVAALPPLPAKSCALSAGRETRSRPAASRAASARPSTSFLRGGPRLASGQNSGREDGVGTSQGGGTTVDQGECSMTELDHFLVVVAPLVLAYVAHVPAAAKLAPLMVSASYGMGEDSEQGEQGEQGAPAWWRPALTALGLGQGRWADTTPSNLGLGDEATSVRAWPLPLDYGEEVFTFFHGEAADQGKDDEEADARRAMLQVAFAQSQAWRVARAFADAFVAPLPLDASGRSSQAARHDDEVPLVAVACSSFFDPPTGPQSAVASSAGDMECEVVAAALRRAFAELSRLTARPPAASVVTVASPLAAARRMSAGTGGGTGGGNGGGSREDQLCAEVGFDAGSLAAAAAIVARASVLVSGECPELLALGMMGRSGHADYLAAAPKSGVDAAASGAVTGASGHLLSHPQPLQVVYLHDLRGDGGGASSEPSVRSRVLAAAGVEVWPLHWNSSNPALGSDPGNAGHDRRNAGLYGAVREALRRVEAARAALLADGSGDGDGAPFASASSSFTSQKPRTSSAATAVAGHGGHWRDHGAGLDLAGESRESSMRRRRISPSGGASGGASAEFTRASIALRGGGARLPAIAGLVELPHEVKMGPVTNRDLFGAYLEARFGARFGAGAIDLPSSSLAGPLSGLGLAAGSAPGAPTHPPSAPHDASSRWGQRRTVMGLEVGVEHGDFARQVLLRWKGVGSYALIDAFADPKTGQADAGRRGSAATVLAPWAAGKDPVATFLDPAGARRHSPDASSADMASTSAELLALGAAAFATAFAKGADVAFVYLDLPPATPPPAFRALLGAAWASLASGGVLAGHDYTAARPGVPVSVHAFAMANGLRLLVTDVQAPRVDVRGHAIPPCCPSWYFIKE